ncbi:MAG: hypothetical protein QOJ23_2210 [Actinomycetota bacterium]|nr:hypothetical protein [Actinomycetota bacterium]
MVVPIRTRTAKGVVALALGGIALVGIGVLPGSAQTAGAQAATGGAQASGMYIRYGIPGFLVVEDFLDGGGPVAQSLADTSAGAGSFASLPYPGETAIAGPGTLSGLGAPRLPDWPFYVSASHPTRPAQKLSDPVGSYVLDAAAGDGKAQASARGGEPALPLAAHAASVGGTPPNPRVTNQAKSQSDARTEVVTTVEGVTATATSTVEGFTMGPLSILSVVSRSVTTYHPGDAKPSTVTELRVDGGRVGAMGFHYGPDGLAVNNQAVPVPAAEGLKALNQALAPAGLSLKVETPTPLEGGASAAALEVASVAPIPGAGTGTMRIAMGGASSYVSVGEGAGLPPLPDVTPPAGFDPAPPMAEAGSAPVTTPAVDNGFGSALPAFKPSPVRASAGPTSGQPYGASVPTPSAGPAAPEGAPEPARPQQLAVSPTQFLVSPKDFDGPSLLAALAAAGGLAAVGMVVLTRRMRKVTQWGA